MKKWKKLLFAAVPMPLALSFKSMAAQWVEDSTGWWYQNDDGSYLADGWYWLDGNQDGWAESYYFDKNGYLVEGPVTIDGYWVNEDGAWCQEDGTVERIQTQNAGTSQSAGTSTGNPAMDAYLAAQAKNNELDSMDSDVHYLINMATEGLTMDMGMDLNMKIKGATTGNMEFLMSGNMRLFGSDMPVTMFYTNGKYYMDILGMKSVQDMPVDQAMEDAMSNTETVEANMMSDLQMRTEGENTILTYVIDTNAMNELLGIAADDYTELGYDVKYNVRSASGRSVINKDGYYTNENMLIDMDYTMTDISTGESTTMSYKMEIAMDINNPGQPVDFALPSTEGYTSLDAE